MILLIHNVFCFLNRLLNMLINCKKKSEGQSEKKNECEIGEEIESKNEGKSNMEMQKEMELQLHEQYAINNNAYVSSTLTLIVGVMAVLAAFGYVYLHSSLKSATSLGTLAQGDSYTIDALILTADAAILVLAILFLFCLDRGAYQRKEQFIIYAIRCKYFRELNGDEAAGKKIKKIFPKGYRPFDKTKCNFVQGVFGFMMSVFVVIAALIVVMTGAKITNIDTQANKLIILSMVFFMVTDFFCWCKLEQKFDEYKELEEKEYAEYKPEKE